jgi:hypothetical protein
MHAGSMTARAVIPAKTSSHLSTADFRLLLWRPPVTGSSWSLAPWPVGTAHSRTLLGGGGNPRPWNPDHEEGVEELGGVAAIRDLSRWDWDCDLPPKSASLSGRRDPYRPQKLQPPLALGVVWPPLLKFWPPNTFRLVEKLCPLGPLKFCPPNTLDRLDQPLL